MPSVKWIRLTVSMFDDERIKLIQSMPEGDALLVVWVRLLVLAGKVNDGGFIYLSEGIPYTDEMLSTIFQKPLSTVRLALSVFAHFGMTEMTARGIFLPSWEEHQNVEGLDKIREQTRKRVAAHREKDTSGVTLRNVTVTLPVTQCNATELEIDLDLETPPIVPPKGGTGVEEQAGRGEGVPRNEREQLAEHPGESLAVEMSRGAGGLTPADHSTTPSGRGFNEFWVAYPRKAGRVAAEAAWRKLKPSEALLSEILSAIEAAKRSRQWQRDGGQYIPHPATWLNQRRWEDEAPMAPAKGHVAAHHQGNQASADSYAKYDTTDIVLRRIRAQEAEERAAGTSEEIGFANSS